ncbi:MAG: hypothetical protein WDW36_005533 [Sanguina aurantia]
MGCLQSKTAPLNRQASYGVTADPSDGHTPEPPWEGARSQATVPPFTTNPSPPTSHAQPSSSTPLPYQHSLDHDVGARRKSIAAAHALPFRSASSRRSTLTTTSVMNRSSTSDSSLRGANNSHALLQQTLMVGSLADADCEVQAAGITHIGFGPMKKENQDDFYVQVTGFGSSCNAHLWGVFDGHGKYGKQAATYCASHLPKLLDSKLSAFFSQSTPPAMVQESVTDILCDVFEEIERQLPGAGVNITSSGTTASVVFQRDNKVWCAAAGDSRVITIQRTGSSWSTQALTLDHRPTRKSEKIRVEAAGARVEPKTLASGKTIGEPRLWLQDVPTPGIMLSRSIGDETASSVGCTARPEVTYFALRPGLDAYLVIASDGVWDVMSNDEVSQEVVATSSPEAACQAVLDASLERWEDKLAADNICVVVVRYAWLNNTTSSPHISCSSQERQLPSHRDTDVLRTSSSSAIHNALAPYTPTKYSPSSTRVQEG